jgi:hypothetical protein
MSVLRNKAAIRWDFDEAFELSGLASPFPRGISFADVDSETEIHGRFLDIEGKRDGETLSAGQRYTMDAKVRDGRTCVVVRGIPPHDIHSIQIWPGPVWSANLSDFHRLVAKWAQWADQQSQPAAKEDPFVTLLFTRSHPVS